MKARVQWPDPRTGRLESPFLSGAGERPLRITFHASSLVNLPAEEEVALNALRELSHLEDISALSISDGQSPDARRDLDDAEAAQESKSGYEPCAAAEHEVSPILIDHERGLLFHTRIPPEYARGGSRGIANTTEAGIYRPGQWLDYAHTLTGHTDSTLPDVRAMYRDLLDAEAHRALQQDILVTASPRLLDNRQRPLLRRSNPLRPSEAARLMGLFLRSRDNYAYRTENGAKWSVNSGLFYRVLALHRLPHAWAYVGACNEAGAARGDETSTLGQTVMTRAERALQERDDIGFQFYVPQNNDTRDTIMRHFDSLTLTLSGALDTQALIAYHAYNLGSQSRLKEKDAAFRYQAFQNALNAAGATELCKLVKGEQFTDVSLVLSKLRNTIHKAQLVAYAYLDEPWS